MATDCVVSFRVLVGVITLVGATTARADTTTRHGLITTATCPYTCRDAGLDRRNCREWEAGEVCEIEDFTQAPGHRSLVRAPRGRVDVADRSGPRPREWRDGNGTWLTVPSSASANARPANAGAANTRGLVTSASCPYGCREAGLEAAYCREWKEGAVCHVEDLLQAPGHRSLLVR